MADAPESTGFELFEALIADAREHGGRSPVLSGWIEDARTRLTAARESSRVSSTRRAADRILAAFLAAEALLPSSIGPAAETPEPPPDSIPPP